METACKMCGGLHITGACYERAEGGHVFGAQNSVVEAQRDVEFLSPDELENVVYQSDIGSVPETLRLVYMGGKFFSSENDPNVFYVLSEDRIGDSSRILANRVTNLGGKKWDGKLEITSIDPSGLVALLQ